MILHRVLIKVLCPLSAMRGLSLSPLFLSISSFFNIGLAKSPQLLDEAEKKSRFAVKGNIREQIDSVKNQ